MQEINVIRARANVIGLRVAHAVNFYLVIPTSAAGGHLDIKRLGVTASTSDNRMRRVRVKGGPGARSARLRVNDFINRQYAVAVDNVGIPVEPGKIAGQRARLATVAVAILLIRPPGIVNRRGL